MSPPAATLDYYTDNGSLPPPHRRSVRATLGADGRLVVTRKRGYNGDGDSKERFLSPEVIAAVMRDLRALGLFSREWAEPARTTVGGGLHRLRVTVGDEHAEIPSFVRSEQADAKRAILECVRSAFAL